MEKFVFGDLHLLFMIFDAEQSPPIECREAMRLNKPDSTFKPRGEL
jgi:hypothetical protein